MNFKVHRAKFGIGSLLLTMFLGVMFLIPSLWVKSYLAVDKNWVETTGKVVDVAISRSGDNDLMYTPIVSYQVEGKTYTVGSGMSSSAYPKIGSERKVAYNPSDPAKAKQTGGDIVFVLLLLLFPVMGVAMIIIAVISFIRSIIRSSKIKSLIKSGTKLQGVMVDLISGGGGANSYRIVVCAVSSTGQPQNYVSDNLQGIAGLAMTDFKNDPIVIDVYVDPYNPKKYYVDISDIPNLSADSISELVAKAISRRSGGFAA